MKNIKIYRTEYKLIEQVIDELTRIVLENETLKTDAEELRKDERMYRKVIQQLPQRLYIKDVNLRYLFCNEMYAQDLNIVPEEISGKTAFDLLPYDMATKVVWEEKEILKSGVFREEEEKYYVSGQELTVFATKIPVKSDNGDIIGLQVVLRNITEDKRRDERYASHLKNLEELYVQEKTKNDVLSIDLEKMTAQRNQLQAEIENVKESMKKQVTLHDAERKKLRDNLEQAMAERKEAVEQLRKSFTQIQNLMNSVQSFMGRSGNEDQ
jgi:PAS domain S-box-containing protein